MEAMVTYAKTKTNLENLTMIQQNITADQKATTLTKQLAMEETGTQIAEIEKEVKTE